MKGSEIRVLLDGWQLIRDPLSPASFHLLEILEALQNDAELILALPDEKPAWLAEEVKVIELYRPHSAFGHFRWVQVDLPRLARQVQAKIIHSVQASAPLFASQALVYSPLGQRGRDEAKPMTVWERFDEAFGSGGISRATPLDRTTFFLEDDFKLSDSGQGSNSEGKLSFSLPSPIETVSSIPYFLYQSRGDWNRLRFLLQVWAKTTAHLGEQASLAIICSNRAEQQQIEESSTAEFLQSLRLYAEIPPPQCLRLLSEAVALIQLEDEPLWGGTARRAMLDGVPVVGFELASLAEVVGSAAYLVPVGAERTLSAALITLIVEEEVLNSLRHRARLQGQRWNHETFRRGMLRFYRHVLED